MEPLSRARVIFDEIRNTGDSWRILNGHVGSETPESEWLDFKCGCEQEPKRRGEPLRDETIKRLWSEALAGFANTGGGVLVWGIDCRRNLSNVDCASAVALAPDARELKGRLMALQFPATEPPIHGIEIESYADPSGNPAGFVVCYVPESEQRPHRAEFDNRRYVIRAGDRFFDAPVSHLRNLFFPRSAALITPFLSGESSDETDYAFTVHLENAGTASAKEPFIVLDVNWDYMHAAAESSSGFTHANNARKISFTGTKPLHPGVGVLLGYLSFRIDAIQGKALTFKFRLFAQDTEPSEVVIDVYRDELVWGMKTPRLTGVRRSLALGGK